MINIKLVLSNIDYKSLISFVNEGAGAIFGALGLGNMNGVAVKAINTAETFLIRKFQTICDDYSIPVQLLGLEAESLDKDSIAVSGTVNVGDIITALETFLPLVQQKLETQKDTAFISDILDTRKSAVSSAISYLLAQLTNEEKARLISLAVNRKSSQLAQAVSEIAAQKGIDLKVRSIQVKPA